MHSPHQFFLTQRSLYLLVLNGRQGHEDADADYWLTLIDNFGEGSPVLVILNKIKEHSFDVNRRALRQKFGFIREFIETDCEDGTGIEKLKQTILRETAPAGASARCLPG
jgi:internalin A